MALVQVLLDVRPWLEDFRYRDAVVSRRIPGHGALGRRNPAFPQRPLECPQFGKDIVVAQGVRNIVDRCLRRDGLFQHLPYPVRNFVLRLVPVSFADGAVVDALVPPVFDDVMLFLIHHWT